MNSMPIQAVAGYPLQQPPPYHAAYGHPSTRQQDDNLLQQQPDLGQYGDASRQSAMWNNAAAGINTSTSLQSVEDHRARRRSTSRPGYDQDDRGRSSQSWQTSHDATTAPAVGISSGWTPTTSGPGYQSTSHSNRPRWTSSDRANSHTLTSEQNLTPSDVPTAGDDGDPRETDLSNDQLSAPIEALRGLADAAAAAAAEESEGHTSNDSGDEKGAAEAEETTGGRAKHAAGDAANTPSLQIVDEGGKRTTFEQQDDADADGGQSPRKKRRRDTIAGSPSAASTTVRMLKAKLALVLQQQQPRRTQALTQLRRSRHPLRPTAPAAELAPAKWKLPASSPAPLATSSPLASSPNPTPSACSKPSKKAFPNSSRSSTSKTNP